MKIQFKTGLFFIGLILIWASCQKKEDFDKKKMLSSVINSYVLPTLEELEKSTILLENKTQIFIDNPTVSNLEAAQNIWKSTMRTWSEVEMLYFGPARDKFLYVQLDNTPINVVSIDNAILDSILIDSSYISSRSSYTKGFVAAEYLLFGDNQTQQDLLNWYTTDTDKNQRIAYLINTIKAAKGLVQKLYKDWSVAGGNYAGELSANTDNTTLGGISRFSNSIIHIAQTMASKKVGKPLGKETGGSIHLEYLESLYANYSWEIVLHNLKGIKQIFRATSDNGLGSYLASITNDEALSNDIYNQILEIETAIEARSLSLKQDLTTNPSEVEAIYTQLKELHTSLSTDMAFSFSITVLPNSDDGD